MPYDSTYMQNLKYDTNEHIYETKIDSQTQRTDLWLPGIRGLGKDGVGSWVSTCKLLYME